MLVIPSPEFPGDVTLFDLVLFGVGLAAPAQSELELDVTAVRIQGKGHQCQAFLLQFAKKCLQFAFAQQDFTGPCRIVCIERSGLGIGGDVRALEPEFAILEANVGACQVGAAIANGFYLLTGQYNATLE